MSDHDRFARGAIQAMGCRFEIVIDATFESHDRSSCAAIGEEILELVRDWHARLTVFESGSITTRINRHPVGVPLVLDEDMIALCTLCEDLRRQTQGAFNVAAGTLMRAHGFRADGIDADLTDIDLDNALILDAEAGTITRNDPRVSLDFGAVAKGFVLDLIRHELRAYGIGRAFVHGGTSSVLALGEDAGRPWRVRIDEQSDIVADLTDLAMGVSRIDARQVERDGLTRGHVMDPSEGEPADPEVSCVACVHASAAAADAYSTALNVNPSLAAELAGRGSSIAIFRSQTQFPELHDPLGVFAPAATTPERIPDDRS